MNDDADPTYFELEAQRTESHLQSYVSGAIGVGVGAGLAVLLLLWEGVRGLDPLLRIGVVGGGLFGGLLGFLNVRLRSAHPRVRPWVPPTAAALLTGLALDRYGVVEGWTAVAVALGGLLAWMLWRYEEG